MTDWWDRLFKFWPLLLVLGAGTFAAIFFWLELRDNVDDLKIQMSVDKAELKRDITELKSGRETEINQWRRIRAIGETTVDHEGRLREIEKHITPQSIQRWGQIQALVEENREDLKEHLRNHGSGR